MSITTADKAASFVSLHESSQVFAIPNPWDVGSARILEGLGFKALATTSLGFAQTLGRLDGKVTLDEKLAHCSALAEATDVPITADLENGFGDSPEAVRDCIARAAETGLAGGSIEDFTGDEEQPIYDLNLAVDRIAAAVDAARSAPFPFLLTARAEQLLRGDYDIDETIRRLQAYEAAGADVLYAPALKSIEDVQLVAASVKRPINVLGTFLPDNSIAQLGEAGARRVSVGGGLARYLAATLQQVATAMQVDGDLSWCARMLSVSDMKHLFR